jgi:hypothetical protein
MSDQVIRPEQELTETWTVRYKRLPWSSRIRRHHEARIDIPHGTRIATHGEGETVDEARIDALLRNAAGYVDVDADERDEDGGPSLNPETVASLGRAVRRWERRHRKLRAVS